MRRRAFLRCGATLGAVALAAAAPGAPSNQSHLMYMPEEGDPHVRTWMAFGASAAIWGELLPAVRQDLANIANTIAKYEPVTMLVRPHERTDARTRLSAEVELVDAPLDDLWMRDTGPLFTFDAQGRKTAVDFNFNGWGEKQAYARDAKVAATVADMAGVTTVTAPVVMEGGCVEVDGEGTAIITESCTLNSNRNPGVTKAGFEDAITPLLGLDKIIWLPGISGRDITDGHTDFYARFTQPGVVVAAYEPDPESYEHPLTRRHLDMLLSASDAHGRKLEVVTLSAPTNFAVSGDAEDFAAGYVGYYVCNGAVIMQSFGDRRADAEARDKLSELFPGRVMEQLRVNGIAAGGGSIHCATQQEPRLPHHG